MNKFKYNKTEFEDEILRREIECLIHFTTTKNLYSIFEKKRILSRNQLNHMFSENDDSIDIIVFNDLNRYDDNNYINLSITYPNFPLFKKFKEVMKNDITTNWCILKLNPNLIFLENTKFAVMNAASNKAKEYGITGNIEKFKMMFEQKIGNIYRQDKPLNITTDIQAEVLVLNEITIDNILEVCFETNEDLQSTKAALCDFNIKNLKLEPELFSINSIVNR